MRLTRRPVVQRGREGQERQSALAKSTTMASRPCWVTGYQPLLVRPSGQRA